MSNNAQDKAAELRSKLIRNFLEVPRERYLREPRYDSLVGAVSEGTVARKLGCGVDTVAPGQQSCPYHFHHTQEEMFIVLEGQGTLRVRAQSTHSFSVFAGCDAGIASATPASPEYATGWKSRSGS